MGFPMLNWDIIFRFLIHEITRMAALESFPIFFVWDIGKLSNEAILVILCIKQIFYIVTLSFRGSMDRLLAAAEHPKFGSIT